MIFHDKVLHYAHRESVSVLAAAGPSLYVTALRYKCE